MMSEKYNLRLLENNSSLVEKYKHDVNKDISKYISDKSSI